jgi:glycosyltransferase involved in cell wall biosynthesis
MSNLKISVITALFNREKTIARALTTVNNQTYKNIEKVIIDGASTDSSMNIVRPFISDSDICISEKDEGLYDALNKGVALATGDIIAFLHSDDMYFDEFVLEEVAKVFSKTNADIVYGDACFFRKENVNQSIRNYQSDELSKKNLAWGKMPAHTAMFINKKVYKKYGSFKNSYQICADYEYLCRIANDMELKAIYLPQTLVKMQTGGISTGGIKNTILLNKEVLKACLDNNIETNMMMILSKYPSKLLQFIKPRIK